MVVAFVLLASLFPLRLFVFLNCTMVWFSLLILRFYGLVEKLFIMNLIIVVIFTEVIGFGE